MNPIKAPERLFGLDFMRTVAISLVLICHVMLMLRFSLPSLTGWSIMAGYFGVELFFVLSGFLIGGILIRDFSKDATRQGLLTFWSRRWLRTLPLFYLFLAVNFVISKSIEQPIDGWWKHAFFLQNFATPPGPFFGEAWSLSVEEWFYVLLPLLVFIAINLGATVKSAIISVALGGLICATSWRMFIVGKGNPDWLTGVRSVVTVRLDACMYGVLAAWWSHYCPESWQSAKKRKLCVGILALIGAGAMFRFLPLNDSFAGRTHLFSLTSLGAMLCLPFLSTLRAAPGHTNTAITFASKWSYAIYLINFPIFMWLSRETGLGLGEPLTAAVAAVTATFLSIIGAAVLHHMFELPILRWRDRHVRSEPHSPVSAPIPSPAG